MTALVFLSSHALVEMMQGEHLSFTRPRLTQQPLAHPTHIVTMTPEDTPNATLWFPGSVASAVETANAKGIVLLVCLVQGMFSSTLPPLHAVERVPGSLSGIAPVAS